MYNPKEISEFYNNYGAREWERYPGRWIITLDKIFSKDDMVISAVKVESEDKSNNFYATSFFTIKNNLIHEITEYWGENNEPPIWRIEESLSERY